MNFLDLSAIVTTTSAMPAETIALKPTDASEGPIRVASFFSIDSTQNEEGLARIYEVGVVLLPRPGSLCGITEGLISAKEDPSLPRSGSL